MARRKKKVEALPPKSNADDLVRTHLADDLDNEIIDRLVAEPTIANNRLADELGVSNATISNRIRALEQSGTVRVVGTTDVRLAGYHAWGWVSIELDPTQGRSYGRFLKHVVAIPQIRGVVSQYHQQQIALEVIGVEAADIEQLIVRDIASRKEVQDVRMTVMVGLHKLHMHMGAMVAMRPAFKKRLAELKATELSALCSERDLAVLASLHGNGRMSLREVARVLDVPESQVRSAIRKFRQTPGLLDYRTIVNPAAIGSRTVCWLGMKVSYTLLPEIIERLCAFPQITALCSLTGAFNLSALAVSTDHASLHDFLDSHVRIIRGVSEILVVGVKMGHKFNGAWTIPVQALVRG